MKRKIIDKDYFYPANVARPGVYGSVTIKLECGHIKRMKISAEPKNYCFCKECD